jgi:hypothetical protein
MINFPLIVNRVGPVFYNNFSLNSRQNTSFIIMNFITFERFVKGKMKKPQQSKLTDKLPFSEKEQ